MNTRMAFLIGAALSGTVVAGSAYGHHSNAAHYDSSRTVEIDGVVADFQFVNPHSVVLVDVEKEDGSVERWQVESTAANNLRRQGWDENTLSRGDVIRVFGSPHRKNIPQMVGREFQRTDGAPVIAWGNDGPIVEPSTEEYLEAYPADPEARGFSGRWLPPRFSEEPILNDSDPPRSLLPLTRTGLEAWENFDPERSPATTCEPMNVPTLFYVGHLLDIRVNGEDVLFHHEIYDVTRRVLLNTEPRPQEASGRFGVAAARMEGDELVIESSGYPPSKWGLAIAARPVGNGADVPSSAQKRVIERYSVSQDGQKLVVDYTVEDPVYLTEPYSALREWTRLADDAPVLYEYNCETESASRFIGRVP